MKKVLLTRNITQLSHTEFDETQLTGEVSKNDKRRLLFLTAEIRTLKFESSFKTGGWKITL